MYDDVSDSGNKTAASAHGMGSGVLAVDVRAIGCLGVDRCGERFFVLTIFALGLRRGYSAVTVSSAGPTGLFKGMTTATSG